MQLFTHSGNRKPGRKRGQAWFSRVSISPRRFG